MNNYPDKIIHSLITLREDLAGVNYRTALGHPHATMMVELGFATFHNNARECHHKITFKGLWILFVIENEGLTRELVGLLRKK